jgi:hypothetical protein
MKSPVIVDVVDLSNSDISDQVLSNLEGKNNVVIKFEDRKGAIISLLDKIVLNPEIASSKVKAMRFWGHSNGRTTQVIGGFKDWSAMSADNLQYLPCIGMFFTTGARVELRGCWLASTEQGKKLMVGLARKWQVNVHASEGGQEGLLWLGNVWEATPNGELSPIRGIEFYENR